MLARFEEELPHRRLRSPLMLLAATAAALTALLVVGSRAQAKDVVVPRDYPTIQAAVDAAAPGDTVKVRPGTYEEEVVVVKDLRIRGAGTGATTIKSPPTLHGFALHLPSGRSLGAVVRVGDGAQVRISGVTVSGPVPCDMEVSGVQAVEEAALRLTDSRVTGIHPDPDTCPPEQAAGRGVVVGLPSHIAMDGEDGSTAYGTVRDVDVGGYGHAGLSVAGPVGGPPSRAKFARDWVTGGSPIRTFQFGMHVGDEAVAHVTHNHVSGNVCTQPGCGPDPFADIQSAGILVEVSGTGTEVSHNAFSDNDVGVYQIASPGCCEIRHNILGDNRFFGIAIQDGDGATLANRIRGGEVGIGVIAGGADTVGRLRHDRIHGTSVAPVKEIECCGFTATAITNPSRAR
jgi:hypothetical protein